MVPKPQRQGQAVKEWGTTNDNKGDKVLKNTYQINIGHVSFQIYPLNISLKGNIVGILERKSKSNAPVIDKASLALGVVHFLSKGECP